MVATWSSNKDVRPRTRLNKSFTNFETPGGRVLGKKNKKKNNNPGLSDGRKENQGQLFM